MLEVDLLEGRHEYLGGARPAREDLHHCSRRAGARGAPSQWTLSNAEEQGAASDTGANGFTPSRCGRAKHPTRAPGANVLRASRRAARAGAACCAAGAAAAAWHPAQSRCDVRTLLATHTRTHTHMSPLASGSGALSREEQEPGARTVAVHCALAARCAAAPLRRPYARCSERIAALAGMTHPPDIRTDSKAPPERRARRHSAARQPCRVAGGKQSLRGRGRAGHRAGYRA